MKTHFLILAFICLFSKSEARLFRGSAINKFLKSAKKSAKKAVLKESIEKVYGNTTFTHPTHEGDTPHARAEGTHVKDTADIIQVDITNGLSGDFKFIRDSMSAFADPEGFVREGLVFCGGSEVIAKPDDEGYGDDTGLLNMIDGYGNNVTKEEEKLACGVSGCDEGSFVSLLANRIRALGYHVTHSDICMARAIKALDDGEVPTGRTCMLQRNAYARNAYKMNVTMFDANKDFFQLNKACYKAKKKDACLQIVMDGIKICHFDEQERMCQVGDQALAYAKPGDEIKVKETIAEDDTGIINGVRRVVAYSIREPGAVPLTDYVHVTGTEATINGTNGCKSLRQYVSALNGVAQINAFRDVTIQEADNNWLHTIKESRTFIEGYASILSNFYDKSMQMFPDIENEDFVSCPTGDVKKSGQDSGSQETPLCDNKKYDKVSLFNSASANSQAMIRNKCFCRMGSLGTGADQVSASDIYEADEFYLSITADPANCSAYEGLPSVHQYCKLGNFEIPSWKKTLTSLEPHETSIRVYDDDASGTKKQAIYVNLRQTLPLITDTSHVNCGRLVSSDGEEMKYSNKGGNCVPFKKLHDLLYRLEFETSGVESGTQRGEVATGFSTNMFGSRLCGQADTLASTLYTFRQLSYQWDHARDTGADGLKTPKASDVTVDWSLDEETQVFNATALSDQLFSRDGTKMCNIDWTQELTGQSERKDSTGSKYADPYLLFDREVQEAIFNFEVAIQAKKDNVIDNENLWRAIETELTSVQPTRINYDIAMEAAEHFMRIVTTDGDDTAVDSSNDPHADGAADEPPTPITNYTSANPPPAR